MKWKFGVFEFDEDSKLLSGNNLDVLLEPKTAALLSYFCRHPHQDITRDDLLATVWNGQIVSDGAINRVVLKLRKALRDEAKIKKYVSTVPKVGYRFIANVSELQSEQQTQPHEDVEPNANLEKLTIDRNHRSFSIKQVATFGVIAIALLVFIKHWFRDFEPQRGQLLLKPLTRLADNQFGASLSNNLQYLAYSSRLKNGIDIFVMNPDQQIPVRISKTGGRSFNPVWSQDDSEIIYLYRRGKTCEFHRVQFEFERVSEPEVIYQCAGNTMTHFVYLSKQNKLLFVERETAYSPYVAYELSLETNNKRRLSQPLATGRGNHWLQQHNQSGKVLLLSDQTPGKTEVYQLDIEDSGYNLIARFDFSITSAAWRHDGQGLIHPAAHPSYQLMDYDFDTATSTTLIVNSNRISQVRAVNNNKDYLFTSYMNNRDIRVSGQSDLSFNSSVMDYLPALNNDGSKMAFISKRSGYSKIWIIDFSNQRLQSIEPPDKGRTFFSLQWSFDQQSILANTDSGLVVFDVETLSVLQSYEFKLPVYAATWSGMNEVNFSHFEDDRWQLYKLNTLDDSVTKAESEWAFSLADGNSELLIDQSMNLYFNNQLLDKSLSCLAPVSRSAFYMKMVEGKLYCVVNQNGLKLIEIDQTHSFKIVKDDFSGIGSFSVSNEVIAVAKVNRSTSDIIQTRSSEN